MTTEFRSLNEYFEKYDEAEAITRVMVQCSGNDSLEAVSLWEELLKYLGVNR